MIKFSVMPSKKPVKNEPPEPINSYGFPVYQDMTQLDYDRLAFARRIPITRGAPLRTKLFRRIADKMMPGHFEWHAWTDRVVDTLCDYESEGEGKNAKVFVLAGFPGCCVAGHTRILNPVTGEQPTIKELHESQTAPMVMTLSGPAQAGIPFIKGVEDLFEIKLDNGTGFTATAKHRVLKSISACGGLTFSHVSDLRIGQSLPSYSQTLKVSDSGSKIVSIRNIGLNTYYDLTVPDVHHYFAEGTIHHNSNAAKTRNITSFATVWWLCDPENSSVTLISTTKGSLRRRAWSEIKKAYSAYQETFKSPYGNLVDSRILWQNKKGDDKHAIVGRAVEEGATQKIADDIKGVHTRRQMIVIDEATSVPAAIYEACANLYSYPDEFILILIGNPLNRLDQFGRFCEPLEGWTSVNVETGEWMGKPQDAVGGRKSRIVTFDALKSPNIIEGKVVSRHLPTQATVDAAIKASGGGNTPLFWQNMRGFWPPEGLTKTVFSESAINRVNAYDRLEFTGASFMIIGMFDPAFGGNDRPALRFAKAGITPTGKWGIEMQPAIILSLDSNSTNPVHFQLAEQAKRHCERIVINNVEYSCPPENLAVDATGEGGGLCDIMQRTWSPNIIRIEFGGSPSDDPTSLEDIRPAREVYRNKRAEIWFRSRTACDSSQWKGLDRDTAAELTTMKFDDDGKRITLMAKKDYKLEFKKSPDLGDSAVGLIEVARLRGFKLAPIEQTITRYESNSKSAKLTQKIYEDTYQPDEGEEVEAYEGI